MATATNCPNCNAEVKQNADYCPDCGEALSATCPTCGESVPKGAEFCPSCGSEMGVEEHDENRWQLEPDVLGRRIDKGNMKAGSLLGWLTGRKKVVVEEGTKALVFKGGETVDEIGPGEYTVSSLTGRIKDRVKSSGFSLSDGDISVVLLKTTDTTTEVGFTGLRTSGEFEVDVTLETVFTVDDPEVFYREMVSGRSEVSVRELLDEMRGTVRNVLEAKLKKHDHDELYGNPQLVDEMEQDVEHRCRRTLEANGLRLVRIQSFDYEGDLDDIRDKRREGKKEVLEREAELAGPGDRDPVRGRHRLEADEPGGDGRGVEEDGPERPSVEPTKLIDRERQRNASDHHGEDDRGRPRHNGNPWGDETEADPQEDPEEQLLLDEVGESHERSIVGRGRSSRETVGCDTCGGPNGTDDGSVRRLLRRCSHVVDAENEDVVGVVLAVDGAVDDEFRQRRRADAHAVTLVELADRSLDVNLRPAQVGVVDRGEVDFADVRRIDGVAVVEEGDGRGVVHLIHVESLVGVRSRLVTSLRSRYALDELEGFQALHLVADRPRIPVDFGRDVLTFHRVLGFAVEVDEGREDRLLTRR